MVEILALPMLASQSLGAIKHCRKSGAGASLIYRDTEHQGGGVLAPATGTALPCLSRGLLLEILASLGEQEKTVALTRGIVPVAKVGNCAFHALVDGKAPEAGLRIACRIPAADFKAATEEAFGWTLAEQAAQGLRVKSPEFSADVRLRNGQALWLGAGAAALMLLFRHLPMAAALHVLALILTPIYDVMIWLRLSALIAGATPAPGRKQAAPLTDAALPDYSILVPMFRETAVLPQLMAALNAIDYPRQKLDVKLILEESDFAMRAAMAQLGLPPHVEVIIVPDGKPRTKPRALNYALNFVRGDLLTIFDAEDVPEPSQLRKAATAFAAAPWKLACLQAELAFFNAQENWLTHGIMAQTPQEMNPPIP
jgi:hypothetical protein